MKHLLVLFFLCFVVATGSAQVVHDFATVEFSPGIRKVGVFPTAMESKVIDINAAYMDKRDLDMIAFCRETGLGKAGLGGHLAGCRSTGPRGTHVHVEPAPGASVRPYV